MSRQIPTKTLPTVKVVSDKTPFGYVIINEDEFDPKAHKKYTGSEPKADPKPSGEKAPEPSGEKAPAPAVEVVSLDGVDLNKMTKDQVTSKLDALGAEYNKNLGVKKLREILSEAVKNASAAE